MITPRPNRIDNADLRGAEQAMTRVADIVEAREKTAAILSSAIGNKAALGAEVSRAVHGKTGDSESPVSIHLDRDVVDYFKATGKGWQSRLNAALRKHIERLS